MTQTAGERDQSWRAPWAAPQAPAADAAAGTSTEHAAPPQAPLFGTPTTYPATSPVPQAQTAQPTTVIDLGETQHVPPASPPSGGSPWYGYGAGSQPPAAPVVTQPAPRERRRPGWIALVTVGIGSSVLASLLTAGIINANDDPTTSSATSGGGATTSQGQQTAPVSGSSAGAPAWGSVATAVEKSVVAVQVTAQGGSGEGSGVILDKEGRIITNNHVVSGAQEIVVVLNDGRGYAAQVVGTDPSTDIAVIKLTDPPSDLTPATLGDSSAVSVGDPVMAVGNPLGLSDTVTTGIISATDRPVTTSSSETQDPFGQQTSSDQVVTNAIQTDAAVNPGNSGGALVDAQGRVIGITSSIASLGSSGGGQSGSIGLGFAIPVNEVKDVANQIVTSGTVQHAWLGVSLSEDTVKVDGAQRQAATIASINSGSPAADAGLKEGDAVIAIDGEYINGADSLIAQVRERRPQASVTLTIVRDGQKQDLSVTLGTRPAS